MERGSFVETDHQELNNIVVFINNIEDILNLIIDRYKSKLDTCKSEKRDLERGYEDIEEIEKIEEIEVEDIRNIIKLKKKIINNFI